MSYEESSGNLNWWWNQLNLTEGWDSMPKEMRKSLVKKLHRCMIDLIELNVSEQEIQSLIKLTDPPTVWDAILAILAQPEGAKNWNKYQLLKYLRKTAISLWQNKHPTVQPKWQKIPPPEKKKKPASWKTVDKYDPMNFKAKREVALVGRPTKITSELRAKIVGLKLNDGLTEREIKKILSDTGNKLSSGLIHNICSEVRHGKDSEY